MDVLKSLVKMMEANMNDPTDNPKLKRSNSSSCLSKTTDLPAPSAINNYQHSTSLDNHLDSYPDDTSPDNRLPDEGRYLGHNDSYGDDDLPATNIDDITVDSTETESPVCTSTPSKQESVDLRGNPLRLSGGVRRMLASRNSGQDIKYATYSASRHSSMFRDSFYDNVSSDEDDISADDESLDNDDWLASGDHGLSSKESSNHYKETDLDQLEALTLSERTLGAKALSPATVRLNSPKRTLSKRSEASSVASSSQSSNTPQQAKVVMEQGVLKSAKFVEENSSHFGLANAGKLPNSNDSLHSSSNRKSKGQEYENEIPRPRTYTDSQATYTVTETSDPIVRNKRTTSLYAGGPIMLPPDDRRQNQSRNSDLSRNSDQSNELIQIYENELRLQALSENCDSGFDGMGAESETLTTRSASSGQQSLLAIPKSRKRWGTGSDSGSSSGMRGDGGTLTSSEGRYSGNMDMDFFEDGGGLKEFIMKDEEEENEDDESQSLSSHHTQGTCFTQRGAIRKAGWLTVKSMLVQRKKKVERAAKRTWKDYWVCLKGTMLLFYNCDDKNAPDETAEPRHVLVVEGSIAQAVPEHTKRDNIFCLSTAFGDAYLLQATTQIELENWITAIHSACSSAFARQHGKDDTLRLLKTEVNKLEAQIDSESKMKKMAQLQITVVKDTKNRNAIITQIAQWDQNLEKFHLELYRLRCYMASLQGSELPNPKVLLACVSKPSKHALARLGIFSVSSFHAIVSSRNPMGLQGRFSKKSKKQKGLFGTLRRSSMKNVHRVDTGSTVQQPIEAPIADQYDIVQGQAAVMTNGDLYDNRSTGEDSHLSREDSTLSDTPCEGSSIKVLLPNNQSTMVTVKPNMTVQDMLVTCCMHRQMDHHNCYVKLKQALKSGATHHIPDKNSKIYNEKFDEIEICLKSIHQVELYRFDENKTFGFSLEAELGDDAEQEDQLCVFISEIEKGGMAYHQDLHVGDELLVINRSVICDQDMLFIENLLSSATTLTMTIRSCRMLFAQNQAMVDTNKYIDQLTCPPPPSQTRLTDEMIDDLIVPAPVNFDENDASDTSALTEPVSPPLKHMYDPMEEGNTGNHINVAICPPPPTPSTKTNPQDIQELLKNAEQITEFCRLRDLPENDDDEFAGMMENSKTQLQSAQKLRKVIIELIETEKTYVKDLHCLVSRYLEPLQNESFLSADEIDALFGNVKEIIKFQLVFLKALEDACMLESFETLESPTAFKRILIALSGAFLFHMDHFKLYSSFCACHSRAQKILDPRKGNQALNDFLDARNPKHQHSSSLSSYLIKPIQRVLKYPLLLREIRSQLDTDSEEHYHLTGALKGMEEVAGHINDMMRVHEEYGDIFDSLVAQQYHVKKEVADLAMDDLIMYDSANWLNSEDELGKVKKGKEPEVIIFVFRPAVVIILKEKGKKKKMSIVSGSSSMKALLPEDIIRYKWMIPVSLLQLKDSSISENDYLSLWEVIHTKSDGRAHEKVFQFSCSTTDLKNNFIRAIRQCLRDHNRTKNMPNNASSKFIKSKNYTPYGGKRFDGLSRPKRTLRKQLKSGESGSQGSEERSSESGSRDEDRYDSTETDSNSTGARLSIYNRASGDFYDPFGVRRDSMESKASRGSKGSRGSRGSKGSKKLNTNGNNNIDNPDVFNDDDSNISDITKCSSNSTKDNILHNTGGSYDDVFIPDTPRSFQSDWSDRTLQRCHRVIDDDDDLVCAEIVPSLSPTAEQINDRLQALDLSMSCQQNIIDPNHSSHHPSGDIASINRTLNKSPSTNTGDPIAITSRSSSYDNISNINLDPATESALRSVLASSLDKPPSMDSEQSDSVSGSFEV